MIWTINQEPVNGVMFRGQSTVVVKNRHGAVGKARVEYSPTCRVVGPVLDCPETDAEGSPIREPQVLDSRPIFR